MCRGSRDRRASKKEMRNAIILECAAALRGAAHGGGAKPRVAHGIGQVLAASFRTSSAALTGSVVETRRAGAMWRVSLMQKPSCPGVRLTPAMRRKLSDLSSVGFRVKREAGRAPLRCDGAARPDQGKVQLSSTASGPPLLPHARRLRNTLFHMQRAAARHSSDGWRILFAPDGLPQSRLSPNSHQHGFQEVQEWPIRKLRTLCRKAL
jgi:hypothetical protein